MGQYYVFKQRNTDLIGKAAVSQTDQHNPAENSSTPQTPDNAAVGSKDQHKNTIEKLPPLQIQGKLKKLSSSFIMTSNKIQHQIGGPT